jgi:hypothetical protein
MAAPVVAGDGRDEAVVLKGVGPEGPREGKISRLC